MLDSTQSPMLDRDNPQGPGDNTSGNPAKSGWNAVAGRIGGIAVSDQRKKPGERPAIDIAPASLVARIHNGDKLAESEFAKKYWRGVLVLLRQYLQDEETAKDLCQDTMLVVIRRLRDRGIDDPSALSAFVRSTAINKAKAYFRKRDRQRTDVRSEVIETAVDTSESLFDRVATEQMIEFVEKVCGELNERDQEILHRFYVLFQEKDEICRALSLSHDHYYRVMHRARNRLRRLVHQYRSVPGPSSQPENDIPRQPSSGSNAKRSPGDAA